MNLHPPARIQQRLRAAAFVASLVLVSQSFAYTLYTWTNGAVEANKNVWKNSAGYADNWNPSNRYVGIPGFAQQDAAVIDGNYTITTGGTIAFETGSATGLQSETFTALTIKGGASVIATFNFTVTSSSDGGGTVVRNVLIGTGSLLSVDGKSLYTGAFGETAATTTWTINGTVQTYNFIGNRSTSTNAAENGGFILNVDGGSFIVTNTMNWANTGNAMSQSVGEINISNNGTVSFNALGKNSFSESGYNNVITFVDGTGSLTFGNAGYSTLAAVQGLIDNGHIVLKDGVQGSLDITDIGNNQWQITVAHVIPEPAMASLLMAGAVLFGLGFRRSRRSV